VNLKGRNIILGLTGSVASTLALKIHDALVEAGANVKVVATERSLEFFANSHGKTFLYSMVRTNGKEYDKVPLLVDSDEWLPTWTKDMPVLHIELRKWANAMVVAPLSANTLAKMANGFCDNLLTSIVRAWDMSKPMIVAPAMNTMMWDNPLTARHLSAIEDVYGAVVVQPVSKTLACNDVGIGAMADIGDIVQAVDDSLRWLCPIEHCRGIPVGLHPGAFGVKRKYVHHCGVDLYCNDGDLVRAAEDGIIVNFEPFTGPSLGHDWWEPTACILIRGTSGVVCYGEINPDSFPGMKPQIGKFVKKGEQIAYVKRVLKLGKERPDIPGHSLSMLHLELYDTNLSERAVKTIDWPLDASKEPKLSDPTSHLLNCDIGNGKHPVKLEPQKTQ
jgi:phosphopantothenoylcysteine decarboxylase